jgi:hypothetical protein
LVVKVDLLTPTQIQERIDKGLSGSPDYLEIVPVANDIKRTTSTRITLAYNPTVKGAPTITASLNAGYNDITVNIKCSQYGYISYAVSKVH